MADFVWEDRFRLRWQISFSVKKRNFVFSAGFRWGRKHSGKVMSFWGFEISFFSIRMKDLILESQHSYLGPETWSRISWGSRSFLWGISLKDYRTLGPWIKIRKSRWRILGTLSPWKLCKGTLSPEKESTGADQQQTKVPGDYWSCDSQGASRAKILDHEEPTDQIGYRGVKKLRPEGLCKPKESHRGPKGAKESQKDVRRTNGWDLSFEIDGRQQQRPQRATRGCGTHESERTKQGEDRPFLFLQGNDFFAPTTVNLGVKGEVQTPDTLVRVRFLQRFNFSPLWALYPCLNSAWSSFKNSE